MSVLFSVTISVSVAAALFLLFKGRIAKRYGFGIIYILSLILAIRLIIPYSIQLPEAPVLNLVIPSFVPVVWAVGAVLCILFQAGKYLYFRKTLLSDSLPASAEKELADSVRKELFIDNEIPVLRSGRIGSPMLLGFGKPVIFLPLQDYSEAELMMILRHELMHFKHGDAYKKLFFAGVAAVQWFNPFAWLIKRECSGSLEALCDREVTKNKDASYKRDYCYLLLKTGKTTGGLSSTASYFSTKEMLKLRINSVFEGGKKKRGGALVVSSIVCVSLMTGLLCSCTVETPQDVIDEMNRIESGVSNEKETGFIDGENVSVTLRPVSEVTAAAREEIAKIAAADGIFKLDNCEIIMPQVDSIPIYSQNFLYGIETPGFIPYYSGFHNLKLLAGLNRRIDSDRIKKAMQRVGLNPNLKLQVRKYSLGMRQRLGLAQAIMENPELLILDEPMNGLDKDGVADMRRYLLELKEQGKTILIASHNSEDISALCDTVCEMEKGVISEIR